MYAGDNKDQLPAFRANDFGGDLQTVNNYLWTLNDKTPPNPDMGANIGRMIATGYFGKVDPNAPDWTAPDGQFLRLQRKYAMCPATDQSLLQIGSPERAFLYFQPHVAWRNGKLTRWWPKLSGYGMPPKNPVPATNGLGESDPLHAFTSRMALIVDPINDNTFATHKIGKSLSWNVGYADGSVKTAVVRPDVSRASGAKMTGWNRMLDVLGYVESVADQGPVDPPNVWNKYNWIPTLQ